MYTIVCGMQPVQNTQIDFPEGARCTLSVTFRLTLITVLVVLGWCISWVGVFLEHVHRTLKASK